MKTTEQWFESGIGLHCLDHLAKRFGKGWEDGMFHKGGIATGTWIVCGNATGKKLRAILSLYESEKEFLAD